MANVKIVKQIVAETPNRVGMLAEVTDAVASGGVNIQAICAYAMHDKAIFLLITDNNQKALSSLKVKDYKIKEEDVVAVGLSNKIGAASQMAKKLKDADIDLSYIYGSTGSAPEALMIFKSNNQAKAIELLK